jgi:hypothetical protein
VLPAKVAGELGPRPLLLEAGRKVPMHQLLLLAVPRVAMHQLMPVEGLSRGQPASGLVLKRKQRTWTGIGKARWSLEKSRLHHVSQVVMRMRDSALLLYGIHGKHGVALISKWQGCNPGLRAGSILGT